MNEFQVGRAYPRAALNEWLKGGSRVRSPHLALSSIHPPSSILHLPSSILHPPSTTRDPRLSPVPQQSAGPVRIEFGEDEIGAPFLEPVPERARPAPLMQIDLHAALQVLVENLARGLGDLGVGDAQEQLVIDVQAARVEVGRSDIDDLIKDEHLGMED